MRLLSIAQKHAYDRRNFEHNRPGPTLNSFAILYKYHVVIATARDIATLGP